MATFEFNPEQATQSDSFGGSSRIKKSGAYIGFLSEFYEKKTRTGGKMIVANFASEQGETAKSWLTYLSADGSSDTFPFNQNLALIQSLMGILGLKTLRETRLVLDEKNYDTGAVASVTYKQFPDVLTKRIGVVYECEAGTYRDSRTGEEKPTINTSLVRFFDAETLQTYAEKTANKEAAIIPALMLRYANEPEPLAKSTKPAPKPEPSFTAPPSYDFEDFDSEEIPF